METTRKERMRLVYMKRIAVMFLALMLGIGNLQYVNAHEAKKISSFAKKKKNKKKTYNIYKKLKKQSCWFNPRDGAFLDIKPDGSFTGFDSVITSLSSLDACLCEFYGKLSAPKKIGKYEYSAKIKYIKPKKKPGTKEKYGDSIIEYTAPSLKKGSEVRIYVKGKKMSELPNEFVESVLYTLTGGTFDAEKGSYETLPCYGMYFKSNALGYLSDIF